jgi:putative intracellular protease/amidase
MRVLPDHTLENHPPLDVLLVPGGAQARVEAEMSNPTLMHWIKRTAADANGSPLCVRVRS